MIYPGMAKYLPRAPGSGALPPHIAPSNITAQGGVSCQSLTTSVGTRRPTASPANRRIVQRRPVPCLITSQQPNQKGSCQQLSTDTSAPNLESSIAAAPDTAEENNNSVVSRQWSQGSQLTKLGAAAETFKLADCNIAKVFAEALVFFGLVLLRWAVALSKPEQVTAIIKASLIAVLFALHPIYAIIACIVILSAYLYERMHAVP